MITHYIIKHWKNKQKVNTSNITKLTQQELNDVLDTNNMFTGDFVTQFKVVQYLGQIDLIADTQTDAEKLEYDDRTGDPRCYRVMLIPSPTCPSSNPWTRWTTGSDYRKITPEEFDKFVKPIHDYVQDCFKHWKESASRDKTSKAH